MFKIDNTALVVIDVQGKLAQLMHNKEAFFKCVGQVVKGAQVLELPILWLEQNPEGLGSTIPQIAELLPDQTPFTKNSFSCCGSEAFMQALAGLNRKQVLVVGMEAHICVLLTVLELLEAGYEVQVVLDAVSSRSPDNKQIARERMSAAGAVMTNVETALYELMRVAGGDRFKRILKIVKE